MAFIEIKDLSYAYDDKLVLNKLSLSIERREYLCILGKNGSGKSTLARCLNGILKPSEGSISVDNNLSDLNRYVGMVFQNPDNQFVSSLVREDLAFYPKNLDKDNIDERIKSALIDVDMEGFEDRSTHFLSGGQKQRIAIAGILTADLDTIIFDEVTTMLDPKGKEDVLNIIDRLHKKGKTIIMITHEINEAIRADRVVLISDGNIIRDGNTRDVLSDVDLLSSNNIEIPLCVHIYHDLKERGVELKKCPINEDELVEALCRLN